MNEGSVFGHESLSTVFTTDPDPLTNRHSVGPEHGNDTSTTYVSSIEQTILPSPVVTGTAAGARSSTHLDVPGVSSRGPRRWNERRSQEPVVGVAEESSRCATPVPGVLNDALRHAPAHAPSQSPLVGSNRSDSGQLGSREGLQIAGAFGTTSSGASAKIAAVPSPSSIHTSPLSLTAAPRVKGAVEPQRLAVARKGQLVAAPTGGSDSETGSVASLHSCTSHRSAEVDESDSDDEAEEQRFVDEFGFVIDEDQKEADKKFIRKIDGRQVKRREIKWANMASDWSRTNTKMHAKLKERCRKGIPSRMRGVAWQLLCNSRSLMNADANAGVYLALREKRLADKEVDAIISRDLARTFPKHILFKDEGGVGQTFLRNVLHAYAGIDPEVGYVQGMAFLVAALSTQMGEEECFWALHELMYNERYKMRELYRPGFPLLHQFFHQFKRLLARLLPRLSRHFETLSIDPSFYAPQWFLTLFVYHFPFRALLRVWDVFFSEGWKIVFRIGLTLLQWEEKRLLAMPFEDILAALKTLQDNKDSKELLRRAHRIKFKTAELNRYGEEYWRSVGQIAV